MPRQMRSWMFVPGNKGRFLYKAATSDVDCVLLDLEDGVLPEEKPVAREMVGAALGQDPFAPLRFVRVNALGTPWHNDDMETVLRSGLTGVCLPKVESAGAVRQVAKRLDDAEAERGLEAGTLGIVAAIESATALVRAPEIATSSSRLVALMFGAEDYALDTGLGTDRVREAAEMLYPRSAIVVASASARILSIDGVFPNLQDPTGLEADALQARRLGFTAKSTFNPRQVAPINRIFSPLPDEIDYARKVVAGFEEARRRGDASAAVGGQLVDLPIVLRAQRLLAAIEGGSQ